MTAPVVALQVPSSPPRSSRHRRRRSHALLIGLCLIAVAGILLIPSAGNAQRSRAGARADAGVEVSIGDINAEARANAQAIIQARVEPALRPVCGIVRVLGLDFVIQLLEGLGIRPCASP